MKTLTSKEEAHVAGYLTIKTFKDGVLLRQTEQMPNKVVSSSNHGRNIFIQHFAGVTTYPLEITSAAVGDDDTAAADDNTGLGNSLVADIDITNFTISNNQLQIDVFVADGNLADNTYEELGFFCAAQLFSRIIIAPGYTKASGEDTLFTYTLTLTG